MSIEDRIIKWNKERNLTNFDVKRETSFILEEFLEIFGLNKRFRSKEALREYCRETVEDMYKDSINISHEDMADGFGDIIFFAYGALYKLHKTYNTPDPNQIMTNICNANDTKGKETSKEGKIIKDTSFKEPKH